VYICMVRYFTHILCALYSFYQSGCYSFGSYSKRPGILTLIAYFFLVACSHVFVDPCLRHGLGRGRRCRRSGFGSDSSGNGAIELVWRHNGRANGKGGIAKGAVRAMRHKAKGIGTVAEQITERRLEFKLHLGQFLGRGWLGHERRHGGLFLGAHLVVLAHDDGRVGTGRRHRGRQGRERVEDLTGARKGFIVGRLDTVLQEDGIVVGQVEDERIGQNDHGLTRLFAMNAQGLERSSAGTAGLLGAGFHGRFQNEKGTILGLTNGGETGCAQVLADLVLKLGVRALVVGHEVVAKARERRRSDRGSIVVAAGGVKVRKKESTARQVLVRLLVRSRTSSGGSSSQRKEAIIPRSIATHVALAQLLGRGWDIVPRLGFAASGALVPRIPARRVESTYRDNLDRGLGGWWTSRSLPRPAPKGRQGIGRGLAQTKVERIGVIGRGGGGRIVIFGNE
jgi:hypothetical protein